MFFVNIIIGIILRGLVFSAEQKQILDILIIISTGAMLSFFLISNMDTARWFGQDKLPIPANMKRSFIIILAAVCIIIAVISFPSWIVDFIQAVLRGIFILISALLTLLASSMQIDELQEELPIVPGLPFFEADSSIAEATPLSPVITWIVTGIFLTALVVFLVLSFIVLTRLILRLLKKRQNTTALSDDVYTETIEKIKRERKKRKTRRYMGNLRYSSLKTNRERIIFIYNAYVKRAKRNGLTSNYQSDTANEILDEISCNIKDNKFPLPEDLKIIFNTVKYGKDNMIKIDTDELKRRLL